MKHLNFIFSLALGTLLMSCDSDAFLSPTDNATTRGSGNLLFYIQ